MTKEEMLDIIACGETSKVQFKQTLTSTKQMVDEMVAFANSKGGMLLIGVEDKTGKIIGLSYAEIQQFSHEIATAANDQIRPAIYLQTEVVTLEGKHVLVIYVQEGIDKPYKNINGNIWVKQGADKRRVMENNELLSLFQASGSYHADEATLPGTSIADLEMAYINDYFQKVYGKPKESFGMPVEQLLGSLGILGKNGQVTVAGLLFFGQYPQMRMPTYTIKAVAYYGNDIGGNQYRDSRDIIGTVPTMFREGMSFLKSNLRHLQAGQNFNSVGKLEIPEIVLEELLQNALVHVDLLGAAYIRLLIFDDRVEIINPGCLFGGLTVEDLRLGKSKQRNPLMADFCARTMIYRGLGSGIPRVLKEDAKIDFVNDDNAGDFKTVIWRNKEFHGKKEKEIEEKFGTLNTDNGQLNINIGQLEGQLKNDIGQLNESQTTTLMYILAHEGCNTTAISEGLGKPFRTIDKHIHVLLQLGFIERRGGKKTGGYYLIGK